MLQVTLNLNGIRRRALINALIRESRYCREKERTTVGSRERKDWRDLRVAVDVIHSEITHSAKEVKS